MEKILYNFLNPGIFLMLGAFMTGTRRVLAFAFIICVYLLFCYKLSNWHFFWVHQFLLLDEKATFILASLFFIPLLANVISFNNEEHPLALSLMFIYVGATISVLFTSNLICAFTFLELAAIAASCIVFCSRIATSENAGMAYLKLHILGGIFFLSGILQYYIKYQTFQFSFNEHVDNTDLAHIFMVTGVLINLAVPPLSYWMLKAYTSATNMSAIVLCACTTKIFLILSMSFFQEIRALIPIGIFTAACGIIFALFETTFRKVVCYLLITKIGLALIYIGIGEKLMYTTLPLIINDLICIPALLCMEKEYLKSRLVLAMLPLLSLAAFPCSFGYISKFYLQRSAYIEHAGYLAYVLNVISLGIIMICCFKIPKMFGFKLEKFKWSRRLLVLLGFNCILVGLTVYFIQMFLFKIDLSSKFLWKHLALFAVGGIYLFFKCPNSLKKLWQKVVTGACSVCSYQTPYFNVEPIERLESSLKKLTVMLSSTLINVKSYSSRMLVGAAVSTLLLVLLFGLSDISVKRNITTTDTILLHSTIKG